MNLTNQFRELYGHVGKIKNVSISWSTVSGHKANSIHNFELKLPVAGDNEMTFKIVDTCGDGIKDGRLSLYKNINKIEDANLIKIKRSFVRQDPYGDTAKTANWQTGGVFIPAR